MRSTFRYLLLGNLLTPFLASAQDDPLLSSWFTAPTGTYARLYESTEDLLANQSVTTWSRGEGIQSAPTYAGVSEVSYSDDWVYLRSSGLGFHIMGPWYLDEADLQDFPNFPANSDTLYRLPRTPTVATTKTVTNTGTIGYFVDGVAMFDFTDTFSYSNANAADASPVANFAGRGDGIWNRDAYINEGVTFDPAFAHQAGSHYHYHANAPALRYQLGDHVDYDATTRTYAERDGLPASHSPIVAWARDGYPVYGPYGYDDPTDATSGVRRMISGYVKRDGSNGTTNLNSTGRTTLPAWASLAQGRDTSLSSSQYGPDVSTTYILGHYLEDYAYLGDLGYTQGTDFDLDLYNGRFCVTPEYPEGTYAYFLTIEADGTPQFPYIIGRWFYGEPDGDNVTSINETVTTYVRGAPTAPLAITTAVNGTTTTVAWNSAEGATYTVESSPDASTWTTAAATVLSQGVATTSTVATATYFRVTLSVIDDYDTDGNTGTAVGTTATVAAEIETAVAPAVTVAPADQSAASGSTVLLTVTATGTTPLTYAWSHDGVVLDQASAATLVLTDISSTDAGAYTVTVANSAGSTTSSAATVTIDDDLDVTRPTRNHLTNLSIRTAIGGDAGTPILGLVVAGQDTTPLLLRAIGPTLADFGISDALADPELTVLASADDTIAAGNDNWGDATNLSELIATSSLLGAFSLTADSADAAWLGDLAPGAYTAPTGGHDGSGTVLLEAYAADPDATNAELSNLSTRAFVGEGDATLVAGFVLSGEGTRRLLLRGVGPTLADYGVTDAISDPRITLYRADTAIASNDDWADTDNVLPAAATTVGAFALNSGSADAALLVDLAAGIYTVVVSNDADATGTALIEVYLVD